MSKIQIELKLQVLGTNRIIVPGCEPTSATTTTTLAAYQSKGGICKSPTVSLRDALEAIPGSWIEYGTNFAAPRLRWFVLPPFDPSKCPCQSKPDWYGILRNIASDDPIVEDKFNYCNTIGLGYCPSPDFKSIPKPPDSPFFDEGIASVFSNFPR